MWDSIHYIITKYQFQWLVIVCTSLSFLSPVQPQRWKAGFLFLAAEWGEHAGLPVREAQGENNHAIAKR